MAKALVLGATGQDGAYLCHYLLTHGYDVYAATRDAENCDNQRLIRLKIESQVRLVSVNPSDFRCVLKAIEIIEPDEIYNLSGQTSVGLSFEQPVESMESIATATLNILESIRFLSIPSKFFSAGSTECFGSNLSQPSTELSALKPCSPYATAKSMSYWQVSMYREAYDLYCCTGILGNHESPLRPARFVTQKIIQAVKSIKLNRKSNLSLGNILISRDWGWAPEYVKAMHLMLQQAHAKDYIIASGKSYQLKKFVQLAFLCADLDFNDYISHDMSLSRPNELHHSSVDPTLIQNDLGWRSMYDLEVIVRKMYHGELF